MTGPQHNAPEPSLFDRGLPECRCPADCGGRPEALLRLGPVYPRPPAITTAPPAVTYQPTTVGELVYDALNGRLGAFMDRRGALVYLRPEHGGAEWETNAHWLERPPDNRITGRGTVPRAPRASANTSDGIAATS